MPNGYNAYAFINNELKTDKGYRLFGLFSTREDRMEGRNKRTDVFFNN